MDELSQALLHYEGGKYNFLRLYGVALDVNQEECIFTFLYPESINEITKEQRKEIEDFVKSLVSLNSKIRVKFKKSFLDVRLLKRDLLKFLNENFKSIASEISEGQIEIDKGEKLTTITFHMSKEIKTYFESRFVKINILEFLENNFLGDFEVVALEDENFALAENIAPIKYRLKQKKLLRYEVTPIKKLFGKDIAPNPELIKNISQPKSSVILFGQISQVSIKTFVAKKASGQGKKKNMLRLCLTMAKKSNAFTSQPKPTSQNLQRCKMGSAIYALAM